jgi:hypothetical protein
MTDQIEMIIKPREGRLLWSDFRQAVQENIYALGEIGADLSNQEKLSGNWRIHHISMQSPLQVLLVHEAGNGQAPPANWLETFADGMTILEQDVEQPPHFSSTALDHIAKLINLRDRIESIEYKVGRKDVIISPRAAANAAIVHEKLKSKRPAHYYSFGELRGELGQITVHGSTSEFAIYDALTDRRIRCKFSPEHAVEVGGLITKRIKVYGRVEYDRSDRPTAVEVVSWEKLKDQNELASLEKIKSAMKPLPEGMNPEDYIRSQRDDD